ncbi:MAG: ECF-type sigma factor [Gemmatales bacterium]
MSTAILEMESTSKEPQTSADLLPVLYDSLRRLAFHRLAKEAPGQTLEPTALVHEAYLRLTKDGDVPYWKGRSHFFAAAAEAMRRILVEIARRKRAIKHGGELKHQAMDDVAFDAFEPQEDLVALDNALNRLEEQEPIAASLVQMRYFGGLSISEIAEILEISPRTAHRHWTYAKAWLHEALQNPACFS